MQMRVSVCCSAAVWRLCLSLLVHNSMLCLYFCFFSLSITTAFQLVQVFSWTMDISSLRFSLLSLCPRRFSLTVSSPSVYTSVSLETLILLQVALFMSVFPMSSLPPLSPSHALSLTHYRHITCPTALSSWKSLQFSALILPSPPPSGGKGELPPPARKSSRLCKERSITSDKPLQRCLPGQKQWSQTWIMSKSWLLWMLQWKGIGPWPWLKTGLRWRHRQWESRMPLHSQFLQE